MLELKKQSIHTKNDDFKKIADKYEYNRLGYIICKFELIDCIEMTEEYIEDIKKNHYTDDIRGEYKVGKFAWIFDDIEIVDLIEVKGRLEIWHFNDNE